MQHADTIDNADELHYYGEPQGSRGREHGDEKLRRIVIERILALNFSSVESSS